MKNAPVGSQPTARQQRQYRRPTLDKSVKIADIAAVDGKISGLPG